ncbi:hypothetical protein ABZ328_26675 [Micromonospora aurantiaca]|uniref:hypothetical protein n=1 Tax=Micromonospora aurantiaca (nom. illeg.) TaxID=47850 RepID=UPI0034033B7C
MTPPFQRFRDRIAGRPVDTTLYPDVEAWQEPPLRGWLFDVLEQDEDFSRSVALRLRLAKGPRELYSGLLARVPTDDLLDVVDAVLQLHSEWGASHSPYRSQRRGEWDEAVTALEVMLSEGGSLWTVDYAERRLVRRVDETVQAAMDAASISAKGGAASHLRAAWAAAYGRDPDPDKVFNEAIRAVEELACPLVEEKKAGSNRSTLGTVIGELNNASAKWELLLPDKSGAPRGVASLVGMMETLWQAQHSRHGGGTNSRRQSQEEAEAAVHLAVLLVQWLSTGVLRKA